MVEILVGMALFSVVFLIIMNCYGTGWRTHAKTLADYQIQREARGLVSAIARGETAGGTVVQGLVRAREVVTDQQDPALAFRVTWTDSQGGAHDDTVTYYLSGNKIYRTVCPYFAPLTPVRTGGAEVASHVAGFELSPSGTIPVEITVIVTHPRGASITLRTKITPRNVLPGG